MEPNSGGPGPAVLSEAASATLGEGIALILARWTALQMAVENEWGGRDSRKKSADLAAEILAWFATAGSKQELYIDDLEGLLDERMVLGFNSEVEDGSVEEVAEKLMVLHEECLVGNFATVERLRASSSGAGSSVAQSRRVAGCDGDDAEVSTSDEEEDEPGMMDVDELKPKLHVAAAGENSTQLRESAALQESAAAVAVAVAEEDGWSVVAPRRNRGKKTG